MDLLEAFDTCDKRHCGAHPLARRRGIGSLLYTSPSDPFVRCLCSWGRAHSCETTADGTGFSPALHQAGFDRYGLFPLAHVAGAEAPASVEHDSFRLGAEFFAVARGPRWQIAGVLYRRVGSEYPTSALAAHGTLADVLTLTLSHLNRNLHLSHQMLLSESRVRAQLVADIEQRIGFAPGSIASHIPV